MIEVDQTATETETVTPPSPSPFGVVRAGIDSLRAKWSNAEHRAPVLFTASSIWLSVLGMIGGVAVVHYIDPKELGLWASVALVQTYAAFVLAGVQNGLSRELPYYLGANNEGTARSLAATTLYYTFGICALALFGGLGVSIFLGLRHADPRLIYAVIAVTFLVVFKFYQSYLFTTYRSKNSFGALAMVQIWQGVVTLVSLPLIILGYNGMLTRLVVISGVAMYLMHRVRPMSVSPSWKTDSFVLLFKTGIPIFATDYMASCAGTFDKVALLKFGGVEQMGYYTLALSAYSAFQVVPQSISHYIYPRMSHHFGRTNSPKVVWGMAWRINLIVVAAMLPLAVIGSFMMPPVVKFLFPKFVTGTHAAQIALFAAVGYGACTGTNALLSLKAWKHLIAYQVVYSILLIAGPFVGIRLFSSPLVGVAYGVLFANAVGATFGLIITLAATHRYLFFAKPFDPVLDEEVPNPTDTKPDDIP